MILRQIVTQILAEYPSLRAAEEALGIDHVYLWRMKKGIKKNPSNDILKRLGIKAVSHQETQYDYRATRGS